MLVETRLSISLVIKKLLSLILDGTYLLVFHFPSCLNSSCLNSSYLNYSCLNCINGGLSLTNCDSSSCLCIYSCGFHLPECGATVSCLSFTRRSLGFRCVESAEGASYLYSRS
ncbi:hypothetical protein Hanom_Chr03g00262991 [Helianthus anomalus]